MLRFDHVGVVVEDLDDAAAFFADLGFEVDGRMRVEGDTVSRINGLEDVQAEIAMAKTPDGTGTLELVKYHAPAGGEAVHALPANRPGYRHICLEVDDVNAIVDGLREKGFGTVGDVCDYGRSYRLVYVRGPEGLIVELAEKLT